MNLVSNRLFEENQAKRVGVTTDAQEIRHRIRASSGQDYPGLGSVFVSHANTTRRCVWQVLFHEIGHHIHRTVRPEHNEKEDVADKWAGKLNGNFVRKKYWYAIPVLIPAVKVYKFMRAKKWI